MSNNIREMNYWVLVRPSQDVKGQWVAHCLDIDVVTQGNSLRHATEMVVEAIEMVVNDDLKAGRDPLDRRASREFWEPLWLVVRHGKPMKREELFKKTEDSPETHDIGVVAAQVLVTWVEKNKEAVESSKWEIPASWGEDAHCS